MTQQAKPECKFVIDFLKEPDSFYLGNKTFRAQKMRKSLAESDLSLYRIEEITFEDKAPRKEALENVISSLQIKGIHFVYLILGDKRGVQFYFGISRDLSAATDEIETPVYDVGQHVLKPSLNGNFRGSRITEVRPNDKELILRTVRDMKHHCCLEGVPGINEDNEKFQSVDRLVDVMLGDDFCLMIVAKPLMFSDIRTIENQLYDVYDAMAPLAKRSVQESAGTTEGQSASKTASHGETVGKSETVTHQEGKGTNVSDSSGDSKGEQIGTSKGTGMTINLSGGSNRAGEQKSESSNEGSSNQKSTGTNTSHTDGSSTNESDSKTTGTSSSVNTGTSTNEGKNFSSNESHATTMEFVDKRTQDWISYLDEVVFKRLDYGKGKGIFITSVALFTQRYGSMEKLGNTVKALYSGETGNKIPLRKIKLKSLDERVNALTNLQVPLACENEGLTQNERKTRVLLSQYVGEQIYFGNWLSTNELSLIAGLPLKEVVGVSLKEEVEFGLNILQDVAPENQIFLGRLLQSGREIQHTSVFLDKENLDKHIFITGVTGSGKTTTCQNILWQSQLPFLIIEPAKTEYRNLVKQYSDLLVFTLGKDSVAPFRLNPFEFFAHESITSRVDMLKASIEAAFDMEAAIPQLIESAIYECYKDYGWNIAMNRNERYEDPFADGVYAFPTLSDLLAKIQSVVVEQGFDERLKRDYIGSIKARLQGLTLGAKGLMLDTPRSVDFEALIDRRVVLEMEEIRNASEKALIMGFVLTNLMEAIKAKYRRCGEFKHVTLIEEAHRLLGKYMPGDSLNKKQGVETFSDMLAEVRKYGESLIIVDQIPGKLTPEVLKNTNTKIVHKIFAQDDKDAIGNTMVLSEEQKEYLSRLDTGKAVVFTQGWMKAVQVKVEMIADTSGASIVAEAHLREKALSYYCQCYKRGIFRGAELMDAQPDSAMLDQCLRWESDLDKEYRSLWNRLQPSARLLSILTDAEKSGTLPILISHLLRGHYEDTPERSLAELKTELENCIRDLLSDEWKVKKRHYDNSLRVNKVKGEK